MRFVIYLDDHEPAHVHVYGDGEARIDIVNLNVLSVRGMSKRDTVRALSVVSRHRSYFLHCWTDIHG
ncbi:DUF4160 domain-containing protein [Devosia sp. YIM 151766]|uniref:DUF4160 domain-containing protein n=1 Tax=Devosia sp. YIM 151766 TaxID=3017325 RepID=UPI00255CB242|nr:DUF4160 domain-containing protein [Devosia sp. YIM 151766]WIY53724.1 DUF4160 domain-containing protein [Devosia sp. YIM 151766]